MLLTKDTTRVCYSQRSKHSIGFIRLHIVGENRKTLCGYQTDEWGWVFRTDDYSPVDFTGCQKCEAIIRRMEEDE